MQTETTQTPVYACQNCATNFTPPIYKEEPMILLEDGDYYWVSRHSRKMQIELEKCCELPYIQELKQ